MAACQECGKEIPGSKWDKPSRPRVVCSRQCRGRMGRRKSAANAREETRRVIAAAGEVECRECGKEIPRSKWDRPKAESRVACSRQCAGKMNTRKRKKPAWKGAMGAEHPRFKGGRVSNHGYTMVTGRDHPFPRRGHYILEHVMVIERHIGRRIAKSECVHHVNHVKTDNRLENLMLMSWAEHAKLHGQERRDAR